MERHGEVKVREEEEMYPTWLRYNCKGASRAKNKDGCNGRA